MCYSIGDGVLCLSSYTIRSTYKEKTMQKYMPVVIIAIGITVATVISVLLALFFTQDIRALWGLVALLLPGFIALAVLEEISDPEKEQQPQAA